MPIRDDLVQRTIEALANALARLARQPDAAEAEAIGARFDHAYRDHLGTTADVVRQLSSEQLLAVISTTGSVDGERAYLTAALLELDAAIPDRDAEMVATLRVRALDLYCEAGCAAVGEEDLAERVRRVRVTLLDHVLPEASYGRLLRYRHHDGQYAVAEDLLFEWLEEHGPTPTLVEVGERFYDDLGGIADEALTAGELPRDEVHEGRLLFRRSLATALV